MAARDGRLDGHRNGHRNAPGDGGRDGLRWTPSRRGLVLRAAALAALGAAVPVAAGERRAAATGRWARPVAGDHRVTAPYGIPGRWQAGRHTGIDFAMPVGTPVYSVGTGTVVLAGWAGSYGKAVKIRMDDGHYVLFAHLSEVSTSAGARVRAGSRLGSSGDTGRTTGPHLHFEVRDRRGYGSDVDPVAYLARRGVRLL
ncbi:murein hydrolase activator EnvC family protein [Streptomyces carminius]|nr:M23 family metallopeptidase [Streptomyces carminius]